MTLRLEPIDVLEKAIHIGSSGFRVKILTPTPNTFLIDFEAPPILVGQSLNPWRQGTWRPKNVV